MFGFILKSPEPHPGESTKPCFLIFANIASLNRGHLHKHVVNWQMGIFAENIHDLILSCRQIEQPFCLKHIRKHHSDQCCSFGYDLVFGNIRGLHCTWLVPRTRPSFDGVDDSNSGKCIHLKRSIDRGGFGPIGLHRYCIMLCGRVRPPGGEQEVLETKVCPRADLVGALGVCSLMF
ncbi:hypothetical protein M9H77_23049 [Catharanthus roseus]|uniref:Uncharacterized protein n=1 Tax=Catharanthus roseus TaxID=4058 RepID=A0ACC0ASX0_CATRO|nr:hypothetical protein M9H77_23049 [Catharanthus roseus]